MKIAKPGIVLSYVSPAPSSRDSAPVAVPSAMQDVWSSQLKPDQKLTFNFNGGDSFSIQGKNQAVDHSKLDDIKKFLVGAAQELNIGAQSGPCLALELAGEAVKPILFSGLNAEQLTGANSFYTAGLRGLSIVISGAQMVEGWRKMHKKVVDNTPIATADYVNMGMNGLHVLTCAAGVAGAVASSISPGLAHIGHVGLAIGLAGDALSFGANRLQYAADRSRISEAQMQLGAHRPGSTTDG